MMFVDFLAFWNLDLLALGISSVQKSKSNLHHGVDEIDEDVDGVDDADYVDHVDDVNDDDVVVDHDASGNSSVQMQSTSWC